jgi:glutamate-1-semialdehyde 2,1-aminomutase
MFNDSIYQRSLKSIAQGALTNSKRPESFVLGMYPTHMVKGDGCHLFDEKGSKYIDYICGLGSNLLGYGNDKIAQYIYQYYKSGSNLSLSSILEVEYAELIKNVFPVNKIKILKTGSEACSAALKIARGYNQKSIVLSEGYHGWHEEFNSLTSPAIGCVNNFQIQKFQELNDLESGRISAFILEPINTDFSKDRCDFLYQVAEKCKKNNIVLIFDETITGCRVPKLSVARYLGIDPDILILGKAIGGGMPLSIVGGKKEIMDGSEYFVSSTFAGDRVSMAASFCFIIELLKMNITDLFERGNNFREILNSYYPEFQLNGYGTRGVFDTNLVIKAMFFQEAIKAKILFGPSWFYNFHHKDYDDIVLNTCKDILKKINNRQVILTGKLPKSPFAQKVRDND